MTKNKGWVGFDLDGTLAVYDGWRGEDHIGDPVPAVAARVNALIDAGYEVRIVTARVSNKHNPVSREKSRALIRGWTVKHFNRPIEATCEKDMDMLELWDDRCVQVEPNTGRAYGPSRIEFLNQQEES